MSRYLSGELAVFKTHYSVKLSRYEKVNVISASVGYMNSSVVGIKPYQILFWSLRWDIYQLSLLFSRLRFSELYACQKWFSVVKSLENVVGVSQKRLDTKVLMIPYEICFQNFPKGLVRKEFTMIFLVFFSSFFNWL